MSENVNDNKIDNLSEEVKSLLISYFELYASAKKHKDLYKSDSDYSAVKTLINFYYNVVNPDYNELIYNFKNKYINNEILVEKNNSIYERRGISDVYDYIQNFDIDKDTFNIFICSLIIHEKLYQEFDNAHDAKAELLERINILEKEAKEEKSIQKFKEARRLKEEYYSSRVKFGGQLRNDEVNLVKSTFVVPSATEAKNYINAFASKEKISEYNEMLNSKDIFEYIEYCVKTTVTLIKYQPFQDGNKRTFRSLLNLMFKKRNLPPVYIVQNEREEYKDALMSAIEDDNYDKIIGFYYYKICDSIYELDIKKYIELGNTKNSR